MKRTTRVSVTQVHTKGFERPARMTKAVNGPFAAGHSIVMALDSDEFWDASAVLRSIFRPIDEGVVEGYWVNFAGPGQRDLSGPSLSARKETITTHVRELPVLHQPEGGLSRQYTPSKSNAGNTVSQLALKRSVRVR